MGWLVIEKVLNGEGIKKSVKWGKKCIMKKKIGWKSYNGWLNMVKIILKNENIH